MTQMTVRIVFNHTPGVPAKVQQGAADAINKGLMTLVAAADPVTPVDTGALRGNKSIQNAAPGSLTASVTWNQHYAVYVHFGTYKMAARPFAQHGVSVAQGVLAAEVAAVGGRLV
jgi:HK97 gp10 family phage protein